MFDSADTVSEERSEYWSSIEASKLSFQRCRECEHAWLPPRAECPQCLAAHWRWELASGQGTIISWVVYYRAAQPEFRDHVPYNVVVVELVEGPRMISSVPQDPRAELMRIDQQVTLRFQEINGTKLPVFSYFEKKESI